MKKAMYILVDSFRGGVSAFADGDVCSVFRSRNAAIAEAVQRFDLIDSENVGQFEPIERSEISSRLAENGEWSTMSADGCSYSWTIKKAV